MKQCYISASDGVYTFNLCEDGTLAFFDRLALDRPMYTAYDAGRLFVLLRAPDETGHSAIVPYFCDPLGLPVDPTPSASTGGLVGCHLSVLDNVVYAANYSSGSITRMPLDGGEPVLITHEGHGIRPDRQEMPHTHFIAPMPGGSCLAVCDLGLDQVFVYDRALHPVSRVKFPDGCGPRHLCYSADGRYAYCANELSSTVSVLSCDGEAGTFAHLCHISTRASDHRDTENYPAAIRCDGTYVYVSNRGDDDVAVFRCEAGGAALSRIANLPTGGAWTRDIWVEGDLLICTNERADSVTVLRMTEDRTSAKRIQEIKDIPAPIAALVV
ncbi:MAG: lactonase family protein [Ruminococcaceae bacterium]|nr:lactonase family protein [Oscillospiraceae bacterium]